MSRTITRISLAAIAAAALAAPTAFAMPDFAVSAGSPVPERTTEPPSGATLVSSSPAPVPERTTEPATPVAGPTIVVEADSSSPFDWGSAAIGAGVVLAALLLAGAATVTTMRHHHHGRLRPTH